MTELEAATIAFQEVTIAYQNASLCIAIWQTALSALTLIVFSSLVLYGFCLMRLGTEQRGEEANQHHTETMCALEILIERTARN